MTRSTKKLVHLTTVHNPYDTRILRRQCKSLSEEGYEVILLNAKGVNENFDGVQINAFDDVTSRIKRMSFTMIKSFFVSKKLNADLYHIHDPELIFVGLVLRLLGKNVIFDIHENFIGKIEARPWLNKYLSKLFIAFYKFILKNLMNKFSAVIVAEESIGSTINIKSCPLVLVRNFPDLSFIKSIEVEEERKPNKVFYSGGLTPNRGIEQVIKAVICSKNDNVRLVIAGKANPSVLKRVESYLSHERISYLGEIPFEQIVYHMKTSSVGVVCNQNIFNYQNALPNKLFEYMSAGLPVVFSNFKLWTDLNDKYKFGLSCSSNDPVSICESIDSLLTDFDLNLELSGNGKNAAKQMSWESEFLSLSSLYKDILYNDV
ncbi:glycosyltransferase [Shewanella olleyana]|uniref:glycosyltransferase n=1 Tax=Shewanella olleyana TaxID=135626 RepID=UPI00200D959E|nr:glycosyltransferase [Shewanella olleyana]MCL1067038.1 glycosyltransferase [Shewanella olleyana]